MELSGWIGIKLSSGFEWLHSCDLRHTCPFWPVPHSDHSGISGHTTPACTCYTLAKQSLSFTSRPRRSSKMILNCKRRCVLVTSESVVRPSSGYTMSARPVYIPAAREISKTHASWKRACGRNGWTIKMWWRGSCMYWSHVYMLAAAVSGVRQVSGKCYVSLYHNITCVSRITCTLCECSQQDEGYGISGAAAPASSNLLGSARCRHWFDWLSVKCDTHLSNWCDSQGMMLSPCTTERDCTCITSNCQPLHQHC